MRHLRFALGAFLAFFCCSSVLAFGIKKDTTSLDELSIPDPSLVLDHDSRPLESLPAASRLRAGWERFAAAKSGSWRIQIDGRSGVPLLVEGPGLRWPVAPPAGPDSFSVGDEALGALERSIREFLSENRDVLLADPAELVLERGATGPLGPHAFQVTFARRVNGVLVEGDRYVFQFGKGNLLSFGASRWTGVDVSTTPKMAAPEAVETLMSYMGLPGREGVRLGADPELLIVPQRKEGGEAHSGAWAGPIGQGYSAALVYRIVLFVDDLPGTWVGMVDAHDGRIVAFADDDKYARVKGGVHTESTDGICPSGCEQPDYPMPFANVSINGGAPVTSSTMGLFNCTPLGATAVTQLQSPTMRISDACGAISESAVCGADIDLGMGANETDTNCVVLPGRSLGDTKASRACFWSSNRIKEHARGWLGGANDWINTVQTQLNSNVNSTCNANWQTGSQLINMFRATAPSPTGCNNTCEVTGVVQHEWGHGFDDNDNVGAGGTFDNPSEAYADITEFIADHTSCIGRGFFMGQTCTGYGDTCLTCTGIRDMDFAARTRNTPSRIGIAGNLIASCSSGSGPCGKEVHCESYLLSEALWDLADRDLPGSGLDRATSWLLTDRLWYQTRLGSGGNMYTCTAGSGGCATTSVYHRMRVADDDDGDLTNGTPHAAALYAAFARHDIACGLPGDPSNQSTAFPPVLSDLSLTGSGNSNSVNLSWTATPAAPEAAASYRILRNDVACDYAYTVVGSVPGAATGFTDTGLANGFPLYYRVQAIGANAAHESEVSNCVIAVPQPFAGTAVLDTAVYNCASTVTISVVDGNVGAGTVSVEIRSTTEATPETVVLTQVSPGDATYLGTIATTAGAPGPDGLLSLSHGDTITVAYVDADDGNGNVNVLQEVTAQADCAAPVISNVQAQDVAGKTARITWTTDEPASSTVRYGLTPPPGGTSTLPALVTSHEILLSNLAECSDYVFSVESADLVSNTAVADDGGTYFEFTTGLDTNPSYASTGGSVPIPDINPTGGSSVIAVADNKPVVDVDVTVNISHLSVGQLVVNLIPPGGAPIPLSNRRGGTGDHFVNTIFDDEAATAISAGTAPFTGRFRPDSALANADGIMSAGDWTLQVVDAVSGTTGSITNWTLTLKTPNQACGTHSSVVTHATVADTCASGGAGGNGIWDAGETVQLSVDLTNDGTEVLTGVTATLTSSTPGVAIVDGTASYPDLAVFQTAGSSGPHFTVQVPAGAACGSDLDFDVQIDADQGSWSGSFSHTAGLILSGNATAVDESFAGGIPATWTVIDGGVGGGAAATWTTANPGGRTFTAPLVAPVPMVDSDEAGSGGPQQNEELITPVLDLSSALTVTLEFDQFFRWFSGSLNEKGDVDVRSSLTGGAWVNVFRNQGANSADPDHRTIDLTPHAAGAPDVQVRFHYYDAAFEWFWMVDNVRITYTHVPGCAMTVCSAGPTAKPVAQMTASRVDDTTLDVSWDIATCLSSDHEILYGDLASVASHALAGSVCGIGTSGQTTWSSVPAGDLWFVVTGVDGAGTEATWGSDSAGNPRGGGAASNQCGNAARDNGASCP